MDETPEQAIARLTGQVAELTTANTDLTSQLGTRTGELRSTNHKATFKELALEAGVKPKAVASLYRLSGYEPGELDEADPAAVTALIEASRDEFDYCFELPVAEVVAPKVPAKVVALGSGRGKAAVEPGKFRVTRANSADPAWLKKNKESMAAASKAGTLEFVDMD